LIEQGLTSPPTQCHSIQVIRETVLQVKRPIQQFKVLKEQKYTNNRKVQ